MPHNPRNTMRGVFVRNIVVGRSHVSCDLQQWSNAIHPNHDFEATRDQRGRGRS